MTFSSRVGGVGRSRREIHRSLAWINKGYGSHVCTSNFHKALLWLTAHHLVRILLCIHAAQAARAIGNMAVCSNIEHEIVEAGGTLALMPLLMSSSEKARQPHTLIPSAVVGLLVPRVCVILQLARLHVPHCPLSYSSFS